MLTCKSLSDRTSQETSLTVAANALYSASADELETVVCFYDFHETKKSPRNTQNRGVHLRVSRQEAQSASLKALI